jgi:hydroxymethylbilane synthase
VCAGLDDLRSRRAVEAERAVLAALGGGCQVPIGAYAQVAGELLELIAVVAVPDGSRVIRRSVSGQASEFLRLGCELGNELLRAGAREILEEVYGGPVRDPAR